MDTSLAVSFSAAFKVASDCSRWKIQLDKSCIEVLLTGNNNKIVHIIEVLFCCLAMFYFRNTRMNRISFLPALLDITQERTNRREGKRECDASILNHRGIDDLQLAICMKCLLSPYYMDTF